MLFGTLDFCLKTLKKKQNPKHCQTMTIHGQEWHLWCQILNTPNKSNCFLCVSMSLPTSENSTHVMRQDKISYAFLNSGHHISFESNKLNIYHN